MSKYIIDVGDAYAEYICGKGDMLCLPVRINEFEDNWLNTNIPLTPYTEPDMENIREEAYAQGYSKGFTNAKVQCNIQSEKDMREVGERHYQKGLSDAWEAVRKIYDISQEDRLEIFPEASTFVVADICDRYSASEAIEKIRQYEQEKEQEEEQIQVGDEVISPDGKAVVTEISDRNVRIMYSNGSGYVTQLEELTKTGRHFPEIAAVLAKMKEES